VLIDGLPDDDATLVQAIEHVDRTRWSWAKTAGIEGHPLSYFEFMIAVAFQVFAWRGVDVMVVEVGLGGRLDATNVVDPVVTAITTVGLDHTEQLGDTVAKVAAEKAGIVKRGVPVVVGPMPAEAREVVEHRAAALGCEVWAAGPRMRREQRRDGRWSFATPGGVLADVALGLRGVHQGANALVALAVLHQLRALGFLLPDEALRVGLQEAFAPGRLEQLLPGLVADGAHNADGAKALASWLDKRPKLGWRILLVGMGEGREAIDFVAPLVPYVDEVVTTRCAHPKARDPMDLAQDLADLDVELAAGGTIEETLPEVFVEAWETIATGSLFIAGAARSLVASGALEGLQAGQGPLDDAGADDGEEG
jgi:dihydrofolate synthase/folylpolyglutamate synthase